MMNHGVPWQAALGEIFMRIVVLFILLLVCLVAAYFGGPYLLTSALLFVGLLILFWLIPMFLNLSRGFYSILVFLFVLHFSTTVLSFALHYWNEGLIRTDGVEETPMIDCVYFSITTFTTLGYGDFQPTAKMRLATSLEALAGMVSMAISASLIWLWCQENMIPKEMAFFDGNRRHKKSLSISRMRIRSITGKERNLPDYLELDPPGTSYKWDKYSEEWKILKPEDEVEPGDFVVSIEKG